MVEADYYEMAGGDKYWGQIVDGMPHGNGKYLWATGE